jgi:glutamyl-tRNA reductase
MQGQVNRLDNAGLSTRHAVPTIRDLRSRAEEIRVGAIERAGGRLGIDDMREEQREALEVLTRSIVNKLLHAPVVRLRAQSGHQEGPATLEAARALLGLDDRESGPAGFGRYPATARASHRSAASSPWPRPSASRSASSP